MQKSRAVLTSCIVSVALILSIPARAAEPLPSAVTLEHNGETGVWLPSEMATKVQRDVEQFRYLAISIPLYEERLTIQQQRVAQFQRSLQLAVEASDTATRALDAAVRGRRRAEDEKDGWFAGKPAIWAILGAGVALGAVLVTSAAL